MANYITLHKSYATVDGVCKGEKALNYRQTLLPLAGREWCLETRLKFKKLALY